MFSEPLSSRLSGSRLLKTSKSSASSKMPSGSSVSTGNWSSPKASIGGFQLGSARICLSRVSAIVILGLQFYVHLRNGCAYLTNEVQQRCIRQRDAGTRHICRQYSHALMDVPGIHAILHETFNYHSNLVLHCRNLYPNHFQFFTMLQQNSRN